MHIQVRSAGIRSLLFVCFFASSSCAPALFGGSPPGATSAEHAVQAGIVERLYLGRAIPGGGSVSDADWDTFLHDVVTPRFPNGLTVWRAEGRWRDRSGASVREQSFVLEVIHTRDSRVEIAIQEVISEYKRRFRQEAVLRIRDRVEVNF